MCVCVLLNFFELGGGFLKVFCRLRAAALSKLDTEEEEEEVPVARVLYFVLLVFDE